MAVVVIAEHVVVVAVAGCEKSVGLQKKATFCSGGSGGACLELLYI